MKSSIAATVILYQPTKSILENIRSYITAVSILYVIDNSTHADKYLIARIKSLDSKIIYLSNDTNLGIGSALNRGAQEAINAGYNWLLTMDQDSRFDNINRFFNCCETHENHREIAIFAPSTNKLLTNQNCVHDNPQVVITSGNLINLKYYQLVGGFESKLFIDEIDHDFCLKLGEHKLKIMQFLHIYLHHAIGDEIQLTSLILRRQKIRKIHSYQRIYYQTRNRLYMASRHSNNFPEAFKLSSVLYKVIYRKGLRIIQWEPDKLRKLKAIYHGITDYLNKNYGVYDTNRHNTNNSK